MQPEEPDVDVKRGKPSLQLPTWPMGPHGFPWVPMGPHGSPWVPWDPMGSPWDPHEVPMGPVLWVPMGSGWGLAGDNSLLWATPPNLVC